MRHQTDAAGPESRVAVHARHTPRRHRLLRPFAQRAMHGRDVDPHLFKHQPAAHDRHFPTPATFGPGAGPLGPDDVEPFIGDAGGVPPWDLTDALDAGRVSDAVTNVRRMVQGGGRHPLQVMATLTTHYGRMLRLDGSGIRSEKDAAALLGMKGSTYPAKKALAATAKLGSARIARAVRLLAVADVDLRGRTATPPEQVLEVLVARLASLAGRSR